MLAANIPPLIFYFLYFLFAIFLAFYIPGSVLLGRLNLTTFHRISLSLVLGMVLWGWQGFLFGFLGVRWLSYVYLLLLFLIWVMLQGKVRGFRLPSINVKRIDPLLFLIVVVGVAIQVSVLLLMGIRLESGLFFCCGAIGDFMYHIRLTDAIVKQVPPFEPDMYGVFVTNYHYLGNLVVADLVRVFRLPLVFTEFQYMGLFISTLFGLLAIVFAQVSRLKEGIIRWLVFFLYFGGDFIYIVLLALGRGFHFEMGPLENGAALLNNPPRAFAMVAFFGGLSLFALWIKKKDFYTGVLTAIVFSSLVGFKIYIGIFALCGLVTVALYGLIKRKRYVLLPILLTIILSLILYLPVNKSAGTLRFMGFWRFEEFIVQPALGLSRLELAREVFYQHSNWLRVLQYDLFFMTLFIFSIFGPKLIGLFQTKKSMSFLPIETHVFLITGIVSSTIVGFFFWQESGGSNSFNFLVSVYIIGSIYAALASYYWFRKVKNKKLVLVFVLAFASLNLPRIIFEEQKNLRFIATRYGHLATNEELEAMEYVKKHTEPSAILLVSSTRYQTFLANRNIYLGDYGLLGSHDVDTSERRNTMKPITEYKDPQLVKRLLKENKIGYLYLSSGEQTISTQSADILETVFKNDDIHILKVR